MPLLAVMPYSALSHDSSLDDAGLLRRCERRIATFPDCSYDFSFTSADTSSSGVLPTNSATLFGTNGENRSDDSFLATTDTRDSIIFENTSVNRNPCQDSRRWAERDDCSFLTHCKSLGQNATSKDLVSNLPEFAQQKKQSNPSSAPISSFNARRACATRQRTDASDDSSDSSPIVDNLILEAELDLKQNSEKRRVARCVQNEARATNMSVSRETCVHNCDVKKQRSHVCSQPLIARSVQGKTEVLDPSSEVYLTKLDNIFQKMSTKSDRQPWKVAEKISRSVHSRDAIPISASKNGKPASGKRSCNCPCRTLNKDRLNVNPDACEVRRAANMRSKTSVRPDLGKPETSLAASKSAARSRGPRIDKRKQSWVAEVASSACKDTGKQITVPTSINERSTGTSKKRSKSLSAPPRCQLHDSTFASTDPTHGCVKLNSCEAACSGRKCYLNVDPGNLSRQQIEILKHIPGDLTPVEAGTVLQTVLSIIEQRNCVKTCAQGDDCFRKNAQAVPEWNHGALSKYETDSMSDSCYTSTSLSPKPKLCFSDRQMEAPGGVELVKTRHSSESLSCMNDSRSAEDRGQVDSNSLGSDTIKGESEACAINVDIANCEQKQTDHRHPAKLNNSSSNLSDSSSRHFAQSATAYGQASSASKTEQVAKKSAIVLPYDGKFTNQNMQHQEDGSRQSCNSQIHSPVSYEEADRHRVHGEAPQRQHRRLSSVPNTNTSTVHRHIGWKYPLHTHTDIPGEAADAPERGTLGQSSLTERASMARSYSTLSDGFLYSKSAKAPKRMPQQEISKNCPSSAELPGTRKESGFGVGFQHHPVRGNCSGLLSISRPEIPTERRPFLLPCPHSSEQPGQSLACPKGSNLDQPQEPRKSELDEVIKDLRVQLRNNYYGPVDIKHSTGSNTATRVNDDTSQANFLLSHSRNIQERLNKYVQIETRVKGQHQSEVTYHDNISSSKDTVLTNSSCSNKMLGVTEEYPCVNRQQLRSMISVNDAIDQPSCRSFPFQRDLQRNNQWTSTISVEHTPGDIRLETNMVSTFLKQAARLPYKREGPQTSVNGSQRPVYTETRETTQGTYGNSLTGLLAPPLATLTRLMTAESKSDGDASRLRNESFLAREGGSHYDSQIYDCDLTEEMGQAGHTYSQLENISPVSFINLQSREALRPCLEPFSAMSTFGNGNLISSSETASTEEQQHSHVGSNNGVEQIGVLKPYNVAKLPRAEQSPGKSGIARNTESGVSAEQHQTSTPINSRHSLSSLQLSKNVHPLTNLDPHLVQPPMNEKTLSKVRSPCRFEPPPSIQTSDKLSTSSAAESRTPDLAQLKESTESRTPDLAQLKESTESRTPDLAQLKESTESLLAQVYRKYYAGLFAPNLECAKTSDLAQSLQFLQNFSPISQVDVNTQYPLTIDSENRLSSTEITKLTENNNKSTVKVTTKIPACKLSNQKQISAKTKTISQKSWKMVSTISNSDVRHQRPPRISHRDVNKQASRKHKWNSNNTGTSLFDQLTRKAPSDSTHSQSFQARANVLIPATAEPVGHKTGPTILDVTSFPPENYPSKRPESASGSEEITTNAPDLIVKTYSTRSAVPVDVKVIREINDQNVVNSENTKRLASSKRNPLFQTGSTLWTPVVACRSDAPKWQNKGSVHTRGKSISGGCPSCSVSCFKSTNSASAARQKLISGAISSGNLMSSDSSLASASCDELDVESEAALRIEDMECSSGGVDCNNSSSGRFQEDRNACQLS